MATPMQASMRQTWIARDGLLFSPTLSSLGLVAGFTTRALGSMAGSHHPQGEQARNRAALAERLRFGEIRRTKQVHGREVVRVDRQTDTGGTGPHVASEANVPVADAQWTDRPGVLLGVAAADCVPILVADPRGPIGVAHAGWQGTTLRVAEALVEAMVDGGAARSRLVAALGPSIGPCCYEIGEDRAATIAQVIGDDALVRETGRVVFDLWRANADQLRAAGVARVEVSGLCTLSGGADLWSYRGRDADGAYGTQLGFLGRRAAAADETPR